MEYNHPSTIQNGRLIGTMVTIDSFDYSLLSKTFHILLGFKVKVYIDNIIKKLLITRQY